MGSREDFISPFPYARFPASRDLRVSVSYPFSMIHHVWDIFGQFLTRSIPSFLVESLLNRLVIDVHFWHKKCLIIATMTYLWYHGINFS
jgi:hypothetical protein